MPIRLSQHFRKISYLLLYWSFINVYLILMALNSIEMFRERKHLIELNFMYFSNTLIRLSDVQIYQHIENMSNNWGGWISRYRSSSCSYKIINDFGLGKYFGLMFVFWTNFVNLTDNILCMSCKKDRRINLNMYECLLGNSDYF